MLGVEEDARYESERFSVSAGSMILLYTDGATDLLSPAGERLTLKRLQTSLRQHYPTAQALLDEVLRSVEEHRGPRELSDDLTFVAIHLQPQRTPLLDSAVFEAKV